jgi:hypothetical protein
MKRILAIMTAALLMMPVAAWLETHWAVQIIKSGPNGSAFQMGDSKLGEEPLPHPGEHYLHQHHADPKQAVQDQEK